MSLNYIKWLANWAPEPDGIERYVWNLDLLQAERAQACSLPAAFSSVLSEETVDASNLAVVIGVAGDVIGDRDDRVLAATVVEGTWQLLKEL